MPDMGKAAYTLAQTANALAQTVNTLAQSTNTLAQSHTKLIPIDITQYGAVSDGTADCLSAYNAALTAVGGSDVTNRLTNAGLNIDANSDGIADSWLVYKDGTVTGTPSMAVDGQLLTVTASTGAGGVAVYQDFTVTPGEVLKIGVTYKSTVTTGTFIPNILVYITNGANIATFNLTNSASYATVSNNQFTVPSGATSIRVYFMARAQVSGDTGTATFKNATLSRPVNMALRTLKFPQNDTANAVYYFSANPDLTKVTIDADEGVVLSFPSTNGLTFNGVNLRHSIKITSRDRNNTGILLPNIGDDWLATVATGDITKPFGIQQPSVLDATTFIKNKYDTSTDTVAAGVATLTSSNTVTWANNAMGTSTAGIIDAVLTPARVGKEYAASLDAAGMTQANGSGRAGIVVVSGGEWTLFSVNSVNTWFLGTKATSVAWTETAGKATPSGAYHVRASTANIIMSARVVSSNIVEFYINGVYVTSRTMNGNVQYAGFGYNGAANSVGQCNAYDFISSDSPAKQYGNTLNLGIFGDSISFGEGSNYPWANLLGYILKGISGISNVSISNYAVSGQNAAQQLSILNTTATGSFDYTLILVGTNDIQGQTAIATYKSNLLSMINKVRADGSIPILGVPPMFIDQASTGYGFTTGNYGLGGVYRSAVYRVAAENNVIVADVMSDFGVITATNTQLRDNIHPLPIGDIYIARSFASAIMQARSKSVTVLPSIHREGTSVVAWLSARPTDGYWSQGDVIYNTTPSVLGAAASQYTILGWRRITNGVGNVLNTDWVEMRNPTGT